MQRHFLFVSASLDSCSVDRETRKVEMERIKCDKGHDSGVHNIAAKYT